MTEVITRTDFDPDLELRERCRAALVKLDELSARLAHLAAEEPTSPVLPLLRQSIVSLQNAAKALQKGSLS